MNRKRDKMKYNQEKNQYVIQCDDIEITVMMSDLYNDICEIEVGTEMMDADSSAIDLVYVKKDGEFVTVAYLANQAFLDYEGLVKDRADELAEERIYMSEQMSIEMTGRI